MQSSPVLLIEELIVQYLRYLAGAILAMFSSRREVFVSGVLSSPLVSSEIQTSHAHASSKQPVVSSP